MAPRAMPRKATAAHRIRAVPDLPAPAPLSPPLPLRLGEHLASDLARRFGTPLYVFDAAVLRQRLAAVQLALGPRVRVLWSIKANPSVAVTRVLRIAGAGCEIASLGELHVALAAGHAAADVRFAGPGKTAAEFAAALPAGLGTVHAESLAEIELLAAAATALDRRVDTALRINLPQELAGSRLRMGGKSSRFGIDEDQVPVAVAAVQRHRCLRLTGLHIYGGTQCFDAAAFLRHAAALCQRAADWERELGVAFTDIDLGGGFGVASYAGDPEFDLAAAGTGLRQLIAAHDRPDRRWFVELGRYLAGPAGTFLTRVVRTKHSGGQLHAIVDGGLHQHAAAAGVGTVLRRPPLLVRADDPSRRTGDPVTVGGPLCTPADQFAEQLPLGPLGADDVLAIHNSGAYGLSYSPTGFLSHPTPAEVMVDGADIRVVRERGQPTDVLRGQHS
jgi:diaminopimelate decarboxylase